MNTASSLSSANPVGAIAGRAHEAVDAANSKAAPALERATDAAHRTIDQVADAARPTVERLRENTRRLAARSNELVDHAGGYVRERPLLALAGALLLGVIVGSMLRFPRRSSR